MIILFLDKLPDDSDRSFKITCENRKVSTLSKQLAANIQSSIRKYSFDLLIQQIQSTVLSWRRYVRVLFII